MPCSSRTFSTMPELADILVNGFDLALLQLGSNGEHFILRERGPDFDFLFFLGRGCSLERSGNLAQDYGGRSTYQNNFLAANFQDLPKDKYLIYVLLVCLVLFLFFGDRLFFLRRLSNIDAQLVGFGGDLLIHFVDVQG